MRKLPDGKLLVAAVVVAGLVLVCFIGWRAYVNTTRSDAICGEVEDLRMNIRDFLQDETGVPDKTINKYFERVDCPSSR